MKKSGSLRYRVTERWLRAELTALREQLGWSRHKTAQKAGVSVRTIERIEIGPGPIRDANLLLLCDVYGVASDKRSSLTAMRAQAGKTGWWDKHADVISPWLAEHCEFEDLADEVRILGAFIPGVVQIPEYTRKMIEFHAGEATSMRGVRQADLRAERQDHFFARTRPVQLLIDEVALMRCFTGQIRDSQIRHLLDLEDQCKMTTRVLPLSLMSYVGIAGHGELFRIGPRTMLCIEMLALENHSEPEESRSILQGNFLTMWDTAIPLAEMKDQIR